MVFLVIQKSVDLGLGSMSLDRLVKFSLLSSEKDHQKRSSEGILLFSSISSQGVSRSELGIARHNIVNPLPKMKIFRKFLGIHVNGDFKNEYF